MELSDDDEDDDDTHPTHNTNTELHFCSQHCHMGISTHDVITIIVDRWLWCSVILYDNTLDILDMDTLTNGWT